MDSVTESSANDPLKRSQSENNLLAQKRPSIKFFAKLILDLLYFTVVLIPLIVHSFVANLLSQPKPVKGKVVLVTGSGHGLGRGIAQKFAQLGSLVACVDINESSNQETVKTINDEYPERAKAYTCNVAKMADIKKLEEAVKKDFGRVDILINNAGLIACSSFIDQDEDFINKVIGVNLASHFYMIRTFLPDMIERNDGHIAAISSISAFAAFQKCSLYIATKVAVAGLMDCLYRELHQNPENAIKTSVICPAFITTSEYYTKQWSLEYPPPLTVEEAVEATVDGIRREKRVFSIPWYMYYGFLTFKFLPDSVNILITKIFGLRLNIPSPQTQQNTPVFKLLSQSNGAAK